MADGTTEVAPSGWLAENGRVELLCPFDYDRGREVHGIPDYTLNALMEDLKHEKGDNIVSRYLYVSSSVYLLVFR